MVIFLEIIEKTLRRCNPLDSRNFTTTIVVIIIIIIMNDMIKVS